MSQIGDQSLGREPITNPLLCQNVPGAGRIRLYFATQTRDENPQVMILL